MFPCYKHHDKGGSEITASLKHMYGLLSMADGHVGVRHYSGLGEACAKMMVAVRPPVLNIVDAIWVSHLALSGYPAEKTRQLNVLASSQDPVALDHWVARHVLFPIDGNIRHDPGHDNIQAWLEPAEKLINARGGLYHPEWGIHAGAVTRDESRMIVQFGPGRTAAAADPGGSQRRRALGARLAPGDRLEPRRRSGPAIGDPCCWTDLASRRSWPRPPCFMPALFACRVPADTPQGRDYRVRIRSLQYPELSDESDRPFAVVPELPGGRRPQGPR